MKILVSNDDGIESKGIQFLAKALGDLGEVYVVAPHRERSTAGHSLTLHKPLRIFHLGNRHYATTGTPADCVYLGIREILKCNPDLIVSGINGGANLGTDVHYSGTVAAAREGALMNIPSYAFSLVDMNSPGHVGARTPMRYEMASKIARVVVEKTMKLKFPSHTLLNVNVPNLEGVEIKGTRVARQGFRYYTHEVTKRTDPRGKDYYWVGGPYLGFEKSNVSDCHAVDEHCVSITPITIDCTAEGFLSVLRDASLDKLDLSPVLK